MIRNWDQFNCKDFGRCVDWLRLAPQSLYRISGHPEVFTAIIIIIIIIDSCTCASGVLCFGPI